MRPSLPLSLDAEAVERARHHVQARQAAGIGIKSALMELAAIERDLKVERLTPRMLVVELNGDRIGFASMNGPRSSYAGRLACDNKDVSHRLLDAQGLPVAKSQAFRASEADAAWEFAETLGSPVVVKPVSLARGRGVTTNISTKEALAEAMEAARRAYRSTRASHQILVERQAEGNDYRLFVVEGAVVAATLRRRARVRGDGRRTIAELIERKNRRRKKNPYLGEHLIPTDLTRLDRLRAINLGVDHVPADGEVLTLRSASNLSSGGDSVDVTERIHESYKRVAIDAVDAIPGMAYAGVDLIAENIRSEATPSNVIVSEVEFSPAPLTYFPWYGAARDMAGPILDFYAGLTTQEGRRLFARKPQRRQRSSHGAGDFGSRGS